MALYLPLLIGAAARLAMIEDVRFTGEEALFYDESCKIANLTDLPWYGPRMSGSGYHPGPLFFVVCAVPLTLSRDPAAVHVWIIILNLLGMLLLGRLTLRLLGVRAAFIVTALLASSPWQFVYSIGIWQPHVMLPLFAVTLWALDRLRAQPRSRSVALLLPVLFGSLQIHPSCVFLWVLAAAFVVVYRPRLRWSCVGLGLAATLLLYTPYLAHEVTHGFENTRQVLGDVQEYRWSLANPLRSFWAHFMMTSGNILFHVKHGYWAPVPPTLAADLREYWRFSDPALQPLGWATVFVVSHVATQLLAGLVVVGWAASAVHAVARRKLRAGDSLTFAFLVCPLAVFVVVLLGRKPVYPNYVLFVLAAPFIGYALLDRWLTTVWRSPRNVVLPLLVVVLFVPRLAVAVAYTRAIDSARGLGTQRAFARWAAERGRLDVEANFGWYNRGVKEPIAYTLARRAEPELLRRTHAPEVRCTLVPELLDSPAARMRYLDRHVKGGGELVDYQVLRTSTFLAWRKRP